MRSAPREADAAMMTDLGGAGGKRCCVYALSNLKKFLVVFQLLVAITSAKIRARLNILIK